MRTINLIFLFAITFILSGCQGEAEIQPKDFAIVITNDPTQIDSTGATLNAEILHPGNRGITDLGFIWSDKRGDYSYSLKDQKDSHTFSFRVSGDLMKEEEITYRAYVKTQLNTVYGNPIQFISQGSLPPVITDFYPKEGFDGTRVIITGSNFSSNPTNNQLKVNDLNVNIIYSSKDTIIFIMPITSINGSAEISVLVGDYTVVAKDKFMIIGPIISGVSAEAGYSGDTIHIFGTNLYEEGKETKLFWGSIEMTITEITSSKITAIIPPTEELFQNQKEDLILHVGIKKAPGETNFTILQAWMHEGTFPYTKSLNYEVLTNDDEVYIIDFIENNIVNYHMENKKWTTVSTHMIPGSNYNSICVLKDDYIYKIGGYDYKPDLLESNEVWRFNLNTRYWTRLPDIPFSFIKGHHYFKNGKVHIVTSNQDHLICDFENGIYEELARSPVKLTMVWTDPFMRTFISNNKVFLCVSGQTYEYVYETNTWITRANSPAIYYSEYYRLKCLSYYDNGYMFDFLRNEMFRYDVNADEWVLVSFIPRLPDTSTVGTKFIVWTSPEKLYITGANSRNSYVYSYKNY